MSVHQFEPEITGITYNFPIRYNKTYIQQNPYLPFKAGSKGASLVKEDTSDAPLLINNATA